MFININTYQYILTLDTLQEHSLVNQYNMILPKTISHKKIMTTFTLPPIFTNDTERRIDLHYYTGYENHYHYYYNYIIIIIINITIIIIINSCLTRPLSLNS